MRAICETPKYSFTKYRRIKGGFEVDFQSILPTLYNYGCVEDTYAPDGLEEDAVILGQRLRQGEVVDAKPKAKIRFIDDGVQDDKWVIGENLTLVDKIKLHVFFTAYMYFKIIKGYFKGRIPFTRYGGMELI